MNDFLRNYVQTTLGELCVLDNGVKVHGGKLPLLDVKYLRGKKEAEYLDSGVVLNDGQYAILVDGENSGEVFRIHETGYMGSTFKRLACPDNRLLEYLLYIIKFNQKVFRENKKGSAIPHLDKKLFKELSINLPPLAEQGLIVAKIEELFADIDAGVENLKSVKNQIALYRQSVLKSAFDGTLYKTTEWNIDVLKNLCSVISDGDHQPPPKAKNGIPFIMISNINKNLINFEDTNFVSENYYTSLSEKRKPKRGDVLYSVVGSYGIPVLIDFQKEFCFQRHIALLRPHTNKIFSKFLFYMLRSRNVYNQATDCSTGTAQKTVPLSGLREIHIPVPTLAEQERIVAEIESRFERADALETAVDRALNDAEKLKQAVLKKAFSGELVPQNPDDEPASVLLARIRAARASELPAKKGKWKKTEVDSQL